MNRMELLAKLAVPEETKMVMLVMDGLGGLPHPATGRTELESAAKPNLDRIAGESICGLTHAILPGITPGSGPAHLAIFGYDPLRYDIERGVLSALGIGLALGKEDVAARVNFCTVENGIITDRRAGRISTEKNAELCELLASIPLDGAEYTIQPEREHRAALVFRGPGLSDRLTDSDPQRTGLAPLPVKPSEPEPNAEAVRTAEIVNRFLEQAAERLKDHHPANMLLTRGFSKLPDIPLMTELYKIRAAAIAVYPMYRGLAQAVGMDVLETGNDFASEIETLATHWADFDYFFLHYKNTDSRGEDGDFERKVKAIEDADAVLPSLLELGPDVLSVTGDHSTPAGLGMHSWHPNPFMLRSKWERRDAVASFGETACLQGGLGIFPASDIMGLMLASALRLNKYGA